MEDKIKKFSDKISHITSARPLLVSVLLGLLFFILALVLCDPKYETSDDFITNAVLSGAYTGVPDPHMFFSNILLGYMLTPLYHIFPSVSWYFWFMEVLGLISLITIVYLTLKSSPHPLGLVLSLLFLCAFSDDIFLSLQFTKISAAALIAGGILFTRALFDDERKFKVFRIIAGSALVILGSFLRISCAYMAAPFLLIYFVYSVSKDYKDDKKIIRRLVPCIILLTAAFALELLNGLIWNSDKDYRTFREYAVLRSEVTDTSRSEETKDLYSGIGLDAIDYYTIWFWGFRDRSVYTDDILRQVADIEHSSNGVDVSYVAGRLVSRDYYTYPSLLGVLLTALLITRKKNLLYTLSCLVLPVVLIVYLTFTGRCVYRDDYSLFLCSAALLLAGDKHSLLEKIKPVSRAAVWTVIAASAIILHGAIYIPDRAYVTLSDEDYINYQTSVLYGSPVYSAERCWIDVSHRRSLDRLITTIENDKEHFYLLDFESCIQMFTYQYAPWTNLAPGYFRDNYEFLSGCDMMYPGEIAVFEANGIDPADPNRSMVDPSVYFVDISGGTIKLHYLRKYWYPDVQMELVDEIDGFSIWRITNELQ